MKTSSAYLFLLFVFFMNGCQEDRTQTNLQFAPDMADTPVGNYRSFIKPPEGSRAYGAEIYPKTAAEAGRVLSNPLKNDLAKRKEHLAKGKRIYGIYCTPCHGPSAKGNGTVPGRGGYPRPPDLTMGSRYMNEPDGFYYHTIVFGKDKVPGYDYKEGEEPKGIMPGYGHSIKSKTERWQVVMYLRQLQGLYSNESK